jgi:hypothetical protein
MYTALVKTANDATQMEDIMTACADRLRSETLAAVGGKPSDLEQAF